MEVLSSPTYPSTWSNAVDPLGEKRGASLSKVRPYTIVDPIVMTLMVICEIRQEDQLSEHWLD